jgi:hypothetical protein
VVVVLAGMAKHRRLDQNRPREARGVLPVSYIVMGVLARMDSGLAVLLSQGKQQAIITAVLVEQGMVPAVAAAGERVEREVVTPGVPAGMVPRVCLFGGLRSRDCHPTPTPTDTPTMVPTTEPTTVPTTSPPTVQPTSTQVRVETRYGRLPVHMHGPVRQGCTG